jgi:hypothetical protein
VIFIDQKVSMSETSDTENVIKLLSLTAVGEEARGESERKFFRISEDLLVSEWLVGYY